MNLYLLRHGIAVELGADGQAKDADRPLTPKGERKLWRIAEAMESLDVSLDLIVSSPYLRARQTAEIVAEAFHLYKRLEYTDHLTPGGSARRLIDFLKGIDPQPDDLLLVGHEPSISELISLLVSGDAGFSVVMRKASLCKLTVDSLQPGRCAALEWLLTPKQMCLMA